MESHVQMDFWRDQLTHPYKIKVVSDSSFSTSVCVIRGVSDDQRAEANVSVTQRVYKGARSNSDIQSVDHICAGHPLIQKKPQAQTQ